MTEEILAMAKSLGQVDEGQEEALEALCRAAEQEMAGRLRDGVAPQDCGPAFVLACAWMALAGLAADGSGVEKFTAGTVTIQERRGAEQAAALRLQAETVLGPYLKDRGFAFQGVLG